MISVHTPSGNRTHQNHPGGTHTVWLDRKNKPAVIWAFRDAVLPYDGTVCDLESGERFHVERRLPVQAGHVYRLDGKKNKETK